MNSVETCELSSRVEEKTIAGQVQIVLPRVRVLYLAPSMIIGGPQRQLLYLAQGLDRSKFEPMLSLLDDGSTDSFEYQDHFDRVFRLGIPPEGNFVLRRIPWLALGTLRLLRILREVKPDVVHAFLPVPSVMGALVSKLAGVPVFIVGRRSMSGLPRRNSRILTAIDRFPLKFADAVVTNCEAIAKETEVVDSVPPGAIYTIPNGVDLNTFGSCAGLPTRRALGFEDKDVVFGIVANFFGCKRHSDFIAAAQQIHSQCADSRFLMVGVDHGTMTAVRQQVREAGLEGIVRIVPGTKDSAAYYRAMDVYVCCSAFEGMSNSVTEAMCSGLPVIATATGGNPEIVKHGETGFLTAIGKPGEIAQLGCRLYGDRNLRESIGLRAREDVQARFPATAMVKAHEELYLSLLGRTPGSVKREDALQQTPMGASRKKLADSPFRS